MSKWFDDWLTTVPVPLHQELLLRLSSPADVAEVTVEFSREADPKGEWAISFQDGFWIDTAPTKEEAESKWKLIQSHNPIDAINEDGAMR